MSVTDAISPQRRKEIIDALRRGTVPQNGLDTLVVGLSKFEQIILDELQEARSGSGKFKAVRGEYGSGKTFFGRWVQETAKRMGFATTEVQISETETPLHKMETVYRRAMERLVTPTKTSGAFRAIIDEWFYNLEEEVLARSSIDKDDDQQVEKATNDLIEARLKPVAANIPQFAMVLHAYRRAMLQNDEMQASGLISWLAGQPHIGAGLKKKAGIKGDIDHFAASSFLKAMLNLLRESGYGGLVIVLDEIETIQRTRSDVREKSLNALRQLIDEVDGGQMPGLYLAITGTTAFYEGPQGVKRLEPLAQRLAVDFTTESRFDNPRAVQIRLGGFSKESLLEVGKKVRNLYQTGSTAPERIAKLCDDAYLETLANAVSGHFHGNVSVVPRIFLKKLVSDILDRIDLHDEFDPREHYALTILDTELSPSEKAIQNRTPDDIELDL